MARPPAPLRIDVTPLVGVMLVLLTVMMVGLPQARGVDLHMSLTEGPGSAGAPMVDVGPSGLTVDRHPSSLAALGQDLGAAGITPEATLYVHGDSRLAYDDFMTVVNQLNRLGYDKLVLVNEDVE